jgi:hypothetical protein
MFDAQVAAGKVGHFSSGLTHQHNPGRNIPR